MPRGPFPNSVDPGRPTCRNRVSIVSYTYVAASDGGLITSPPTATVIATRWANIRTVSGSERFRFQQMSPEAEHVVELREYLGTATEKMQVVFGSRAFEIERVAHDELRHEWTTLYCREMR